jgi:hypothetical protein
MQAATVWIGVSVIVILLAGNLRGVRQAGAMFAVPTYAFIAAIAALVVVGLVHAAGRGFQPVPVRHLAAVQAVTVLLVLRAFASGPGRPAVRSGQGSCWWRAPILSHRKIEFGGLGGAGALMARRPGGVRRSGPAAPPAG